MQAVKLAAFSLFVGTLAAHWLSPLTAATVASGVLFVLLRVVK